MEYSLAMRTRHDFLTDLTARLAAVIEDQERLFEFIRKEKAELVRMDRLHFAKFAPERL
jgi:archaellum biogenesis protein FlaJ (TadC family)